MTGHTLIDLRAHDSRERGNKPEPVPEFQAADPEDIKKALAFKQRLRIERMAEGYRIECERDGRPP